MKWLLKQVGTRLFKSRKPNVGDQPTYVVRFDTTRDILVIHRQVTETVTQIVEVPERDVEQFLLAVVDVYHEGHPLASIPPLSEVCNHLHKKGV